jgi:hypothetical protein
MSDPDVLAWATRDERILLTFDKDFGELAKASALNSMAGCPSLISDAAPLLPSPGHGNGQDKWLRHGES